MEKLKTTQLFEQISKKTRNNVVIALSSILLLCSCTTQSFAIDNNTLQTNNLQNKAVNITRFTEAELEQMLAPIALYPDTLLSHILISTTYPIDVVDAERWLAKNSHLTIQALADKAESEDWDASVKALLPFPNIIKKLSENLYWMRNIGDAFLQDQARVLASIQSLRQQADIAGNLEKMDNVNVVRDTKTIIIKPAQPEIIYVPYYDTRVVYGDWHWANHPPVHWHTPVHYMSHHGPYYWHNPVHLTLGLFFGSMHWNDRHVVVHHHKSRYYKHHSNKKRSTSYQSKKWQHKPRHGRNGTYSSTSTQKKYRNHHSAVQRNSTSHVKEPIRSRDIHSKNINLKKVRLTNNSKHNTKIDNPKRQLHQDIRQKLTRKDINNRVTYRNQHQVTKHKVIKHVNNVRTYDQGSNWRSNETKKTTYSGNTLKPRSHESQRMRKKSVINHHNSPNRGVVNKTREIKNRHTSVKSRQGQKKYHN